MTDADGLPLKSIPHSRPTGLKARLSAFADSSALLGDRSATDADSLRSKPMPLSRPTGLKAHLTTPADSPPLPDSQPTAAADTSPSSSARLSQPTSRKARLSALADNPAPPENQLPAGKLVRSWLPEHTEQRWTRRWLPGATGLPGVLGRRGMIFALALLAAAAVVAGGLAIFGRSPAAELAPPLPTARAQAPHASKANESLVISVVGHVRSPGLVTVPSGSRVADALRAAGGANPGVDLTALNLARKLTDGEQLAVGVPAAQAAPAGSAAAASKIDLNSATAEQLDSLPGVGEVTARRITDWRTQHGGFSSVEQLRDVDGIGESKFQKLREQVTVG
ncbi:helix-hairpin-helix domain-containing protein [Amycolatopsis sp. NPDC059090]|uniref:helix-hairpin-helix domain-containing protein n=1 Tax=unclassified Amycolatopsis TaxID=2618356 RepID=UPI003670F7AE